MDAKPLKIPFFPTLSLKCPLHPSQKVHHICMELSCPHSYICPSCVQPEHHQLHPEQVAVPESCITQLAESIQLNIRQLQSVYQKLKERQKVSSGVQSWQLENLDNQKKLEEHITQQKLMIEQEFRELQESIIDLIKREKEKVF